MKLKLLVGLSGPTFALDAGDIYDCEDDAEATRLISARYAVPFAERQIETAVQRPVPEIRAPRKKKD